MSTAPHATIIRAQPVGTEVVGDSLDALADLNAYNRWIVSLMARHITGRVLEVGAGIGNLTSLIADHADHVVTIDPVASFVDAAKRRYAKDQRIRCLTGFLEDMKGPGNREDQFDTVVSSNVVEHIGDDVAAHQQMAAMLRPGGKVITLVPAGPWAFGRLDLALGHFRRYTLASLRHTMEQAGLVWTTGQYSNRIGAFGWWFNSRILGKTAVPEGQARTFNRLVPIIRLADRILPLPFGQSVLGIASRP